MKQKKLNQFVKLIPGVNQSRAEKQVESEKIIYYDQASFDLDYNNQPISHLSETLSVADEASVKEGDVVINHSLQLATIVRKGNVGKILPINFIKVVFLNDSLNKEFFVYLFNASQMIKRQKERETQGIGPVQRISIASLEQLNIPDINIKEQEKIGKVYFEMQQLKTNLKNYGRLLDKLTTSLLEENINDNF